MNHKTLGRYDTGCIGSSRERKSAIFSGPVFRSSFRIQFLGPICGSSFRVEPLFRVWRSKWARLTKPLGQEPSPLAPASIFKGKIVLKSQMAQIESDNNDHRNEHNNHVDSFQPAVLAPYVTSASCPRATGVRAGQRKSCQVHLTSFWHAGPL